MSFDPYGLIIIKRLQVYKYIIVMSINILSFCAFVPLSCNLFLKKFPCHNWIEREKAWSNCQVGPCYGRERSGFICNHLLLSFMKIKAETPAMVLSSVARAKNPNFCTSRLNFFAWELIISHEWHLTSSFLSYRCS